MDMTKDGDIEECGPDEEWTDLMDRGGLLHVKDTVYQLICAIETEMRSQLNALTSYCSTDSTSIITHVENHENVQFYWLTVTAEFDIEDSEVHDLPLHKIVELFLTIRGHSKASALMEQYKQLNKKSTQRSKSLRREVHDACK